MLMSAAIRTTLSTRQKLPPLDGAKGVFATGAQWNALAQTKIGGARTKETPCSVMKNLIHISPAYHLDAATGFLKTCRRRCVSTSGLCGDPPPGGVQHVTTASVRCGVLQAPRRKTWRAERATWTFIAKACLPRRKDSMQRFGSARAVVSFQEHTHARTQIRALARPPVFIHGGKLTGIASTCCREYWSSRVLRYRPTYRSSLCRAHRAQRLTRSWPRWAVTCRACCLVSSKGSWPA